MLGETLLALATLAGQTVVQAVATDEWETVECGSALLLGRGNTKQTQLAEQWLKDTHEQLTSASEANIELIRTALVGRWAGRIADLLEETPEAEAEVRALISEIHREAPAVTPAGSGRASAAADDVSA